MSLYVLDTDTLSLLQRNHPVVRQHVDAVAPTDLAVTIITVEEQLTGWYTALRRASPTRPDHLAHVYQNLTDTVQSVAALPILSFTEAAVNRYFALQALKLNVGKMDLRIGAIALEHGAIVVTRNLRDFQRIPNLTAEDWSV